VPVLLLMGLAAVLSWQLAALLEADERADRSDAILADAVRVRQLLIDRETGVRGFLLTGEPVFLEPYEAAGKRLPEALATLEAHIKDAPGQRALLKRLHEGWQDWERVASQELRLFEEGGDWRQVVLAGEGKTRMDRLRALLDELSEVERERANRLSAEAQSQARFVLWVGAVWMVGLAVLHAWFGRRQLFALARGYEVVLAQVRASEARLEARVAERTRELTLANKELESFSYSVSHDLRTPLRAVDGFSQALLEDEGGSISQDGRDLLERIRAAAGRMGLLIDDLLQLSRVSRAELRREPVDLSALGREVLEELRRREPERDVTVEVAPGVRALGDARLLRIVLENLLGNAWKFTSKRTGARITLFSEEREGRTDYAVRDNGVGFDMAYASKLFSPFQRLHKPAEFPGTGIGLATVQRIIHRHGGHIEAESSPGQGATFRFTLGESKP
jgi:signal transduction histidine kinase